MAAWGRKERYFDAHAHIFNAADVPVAGFLAKSVAHAIEDEDLRNLMIALAPIAEIVGKAFAPTPRGELERLCAASRVASRSLRARTEELDQTIDRERQAAAEALYQEIIRRASNIPILIDNALQRVRAANAGSPLLQAAPRFGREFVREAVSNGSTPQDRLTGKGRPLVRSHLSAEERRLAQMQNAFQFVGFMLSPRHHNLRTFIRKYAEGSPKVPLSGCFGAMVDFNYWLDCPSKASHMRDQVLLHEQIALLSGGFLMPIVAYNPWVDIKEDDAAIGTVKWAVLEHGCVGVKIYPPMGFYPYGNADIPLVGSTEARPDLKKLDEKLAQLYATCDALDIPVMAHANDSNGRDFAHDTLAGVKGWYQVQEKLPHLKALYVNAGHFGGAEKHNDGDWTEAFVGLMSSTDRLRMYGDLGYWSELFEDSAIKDKLGRILRMPIGSGQSAGDRTLYGSDWLMLSQVPGWESYAEEVADVLLGLDGTGSVAQRVMGANVLECFGLVKGSMRKNHLRLTAYYAQPGRTRPGWTDALP